MSQYQHYENLTEKWVTLLSRPNELPGVIATTLSQGGTRPVWNVENAETQTMLMAWPRESLLRTAVVVHGPKEGKLDPHAPIPLMEGFPNTLEVVDSHPWGPGHLGEVQAVSPGASNPMWFHNPLFFRDKVVDLTPGVEQVFYLSGLCYGARTALLDELTITSGPFYEKYAAAWLEDNPDKSRLDVPPLQVPLAGRTVAMPRPHHSEYEGRCRIHDVDSFSFGPEGAEVKIYRFGTTFGTEEHPIHVLMYLPEKQCEKGYEPRDEDEIDVIFWMQGRIVDVGDEVADVESGQK